MNTKAIIKKQIEQLQGIESVELICVSPEKKDHALFHVYFEPASVRNRLTPEEVAQRNYKETERRGQINDKTNFFDFVNKIREERNELTSSFDVHHETFDPSELADISLVCDTMALHYGIDLHAEKERKMLINELRKD